MRTDFFITGTDTDIGKTVASVMLMRGLLKYKPSLSVAGIKPIASGFDEIDQKWVNADVSALTQQGNVNLPPERINRYAFRPAIAPHIAAAKTDQAIDFNVIREDVAFCQQQTNALVVEGVGGWYVPLSIPLIDDGETRYIADLASYLNLPLVLVVGIKLGCLNHAVLTYEAIKASGLPVVGWVANYCLPDMVELEANIDALKNLLPIPILFEIPYLNKKMMQEWVPSFSEDFMIYLDTLGV